MLNALKWSRRKGSGHSRLQSVKNALPVDRLFCDTTFGATT